ncbi:MAG TPA: VOC family protein [Terriglobales bacterium]|nr:VOC family protein [Terriglobales bacterium]
MRIATVVLGVSDVQRSVAFYRDTLGLKLTGQIEALAFLDGGGLMLVLSEPLARHLGQGAGASEVVFGVDGVREHYDMLRERGVKFTVEPRVINGAQWAANFDDPDGHHLCIFGSERRSRETGASA